MHSLLTPSDGPKKLDLGTANSKQQQQHSCAVQQSTVAAAVHCRHQRCRALRMILQRICSRVEAQILVPLLANMESVRHTFTPSRAAQRGSDAIGPMPSMKPCSSRRWQHQVHAVWEALKHWVAGRKDKTELCVAIHAKSEAVDSTYSDSHSHSHSKFVPP